MPLIFMETSQHRHLLLTGLHPASLYEQDQLGSPVFLGIVLQDSDAATVFARFRHVTKSSVVFSVAPLRLIH